MKKIIIGLTVITVVVFLFAWGRVNQSAGSVPIEKEKDPAVALSVPATFYDFGPIKMADGKVSKGFIVTNSSGRDVELKKVVTSCMCTNAYIAGGTARKGPFGMPGHSGVVPPANELIPAGEARTIEVVFDPAAHGPAGVGQIERQVFITDSEGGETVLEIKALVTS